MKKYYPIIIGTIIIISFAGGAFLAKWLIPDLHPGFIISIIGGAATGIGIVLIMEKVKNAKKKNNVPEADERTWLNLKNFYAVSLYIVLFGSMLVVIILFALGIQTVDIGAISLYLILLFILIVLGTVIVQKQ